MPEAYICDHCGTAAARVPAIGWYIITREIEVYASKNMEGTYCSVNCVNLRSIEVLSG